MPRKISEKEARDRAISDGVIIALAALNAHGEASAGRYYEDVLELAGKEDVIAQARRTGSMRWAGLDKWLAYERRNAAFHSEYSSKEGA
jgi:hypothetical protein